MSTQRTLHACLVAVIAVLCAGVLATAPLRPPTAAPQVALTSSSFLPDPADLASFGDYFTAINSASAELASYVQSTLADQYADLHTIWDDGLSTLAASWTDGLAGMHGIPLSELGDALAALSSTIGDDVHNLSQAVIDWVNGFNTTVIDFFENMEPGAISLCAILTFAGEGLHDLSEMMNSEFSAGMAAFNDQLIDGVNGFFDSLTSGL